MSWMLLAPVLILADGKYAETNEEKAAVVREFREEFVAITPGEGRFPADLEMRSPDGMIVHRVRLRRPFAISKYEVTQDQWQAVMGKNPSEWKGPRNSVERLSFHEAQEFCRKMTLSLQALDLIGKDEVVRLPSEAEWEYAARAGTTTTWSFGDDRKDLDAHAWHTGNAAGNDPPVGAKQPNPWGLYDVHGYLWEWCADASHPSLNGAPIDGSPWSIGGEKGKRVVRSGSWKDDGARTASGFRMSLDESTRDSAVGLRCVLANAPRVATELSELVDQNSKLEELWRGGAFTEGPVAAPDGSILFSDIGNRVLRYDPKTGQTADFRIPGGRTNGLAIDAQGRLVACEGANMGGGRRISITEGKVGPGDSPTRSLSDGFGGKRFNSPNDLAIDAAGNIWFSDPRYVGDEPLELDFQTIFRVTPDGVTTVATRELTKPNGLAFTPDGMKLVVSEHHPESPKHLLWFDVLPDGTLTNKKLIHDFGTGRGVDGLKIDVDGNIFATAGTGKDAGVYVFNAAGKLLGLIPTPGDPTNCCFGGAGEADILYVTTAMRPDAPINGDAYGLTRIKLKTRGH